VAVPVIKRRAREQDKRWRMQDPFFSVFSVV